MVTRALLTLLLSSVAALGCTCVWPEKANAKALLKEPSIAVVFRGQVLKRTTLPRRFEMGLRDRYAITFRVGEVWKGAPGPELTVYGMTGGTDCLGGDEYTLGKDYLVYASERKVEDVVLGTGLFWYGWTDILPTGTRMLVPEPCSFGGPVSDVKDSLKTLGKGRVVR
jgi:hypothetical protein